MICPASNSFVKKNEARILYKSHVEGLRIVDRLSDATVFQQTFLNMMAVESLNHDLKVEAYLKALCEAMGFKLKE